ncbi:discoidin domain-containing protein [Cohnella yongneupensis]|uniref:Discoidin domain-containing protein n=1 Tax=Cohnella yongneupensis TaxID=425006 RepID=A0ABW0QWA6_9BACL
MIRTTQGRPFGILLIVALFVGLIANLAQAPEAAAAGVTLHVAKNGNDSNAGTAAAPFLTINRAAQVALPGDKVVVHAGLYRETVKPARGGADEATRITYTNAGDGEVVIKGSEEVNNWTLYQGNVWRVTLPNTYFGSYNPYSTRQPQGGEGGFFSFYTAGDVYLDELAYYEKGSLNDVLASGDTWYTEVTGTQTTIYANFGNSDPNAKLAEINVRRQVFAPDVWGLGYITVDGFTIKHAANTYSDFPGVPDRRQAGAISVYGGLKWIIQNNIIINARTIGIDIGLGNDEWAGNRPGTTRTNFHNTNLYGSHIVRNNYIARSGQSGIAGVFSWNSDIMYNRIEDTNYRDEFSGAETAPIKVHYMNEGLIKGNYIKNSKGGNSAGIWTDWGNQNVRVTGNIVMNAPWGYYAEAIHGPILVDNNVFIGNSDIRMLDSTGVVYANNLFVDNGTVHADGAGRDSYYFVPGTMNETSSVNSVQKFFWYNNLLRGTTLPNNETNKTQVKEGNFTDAVSNVRYSATNTGLSLTFDLNTAGIQGLSPVTQQRVGIIPEANESIAANVTTDFFGNSFGSSNIMAGPFANAHSGTNTYALWPPAGQNVPTPPPPPAGTPINLSVNPGVTATASSSDGATTVDKAIDGNGSTRWSSAFTDNEWIRIDLGQAYNLTGTKLSWEAAYGKSYKIQVSVDGTNWTDAYSTTTGDGGIDQLSLNASGRYVRMLGIQRGTQYGYSLWEFEVYGTLGGGGGGSNQALNKPVTVSSVADNTQGAMAVDGNAQTRWTSAYTDNQWIRVDLGQTYNLTGAKLTWEAAYGKSYKLQVSGDGTNWTDAYSTTTGDGGTDQLSFSGSGRYVRMLGVQRATQYGYSLWEIEVYGTPAGGGSSNQALNKPVTVSGVADNTVGASAVDGNGATRWSSAYTDNQWLVVDLGAAKTLTGAKLVWEAAYGKSYKIQVSGDGSAWTDVYSTTTGDGGTDQLSFSGSGRYVRMLGVLRATQYGYSLWEFEVYGS